VNMLSDCPYFQLRHHSHSLLQLLHFVHCPVSLYISPPLAIPVDIIQPCSCRYDVRSDGIFRGCDRTTEVAVGGLEVVIELLAGTVCIATITVSMKTVGRLYTAHGDTAVDETFHS